MSVEIRPLRSDETDHELLSLSVGAPALFIARVWLHFGMPWPQCVFLHFTGIPCPTCGATRCFLFLTRGQIGSAFLINPLAFCALAAASLFAVYAPVVLMFRLPRIRLRLAPMEA